MCLGSFRRKAQVLNRRFGDGPRDDLINRQASFLSLNLSDCGPGRRVLRREPGARGAARLTPATILVRDDRNRVSADTLRLIRDLILVESDQWPEHGQAGYSVDHR